MESKEGTWKDTESKLKRKRREEKRWRKIREAKSREDGGKNADSKG